MVAVGSPWALVANWKCPVRLTGPAAVSRAATLVPLLRVNMLSPFLIGTPIKPRRDRFPKGAAR